MGKCWQMHRCVSTKDWQASSQFVARQFLVCKDKNNYFFSFPEIEEQVDLEKDLFDHSVLEEVELPTFDCCSDPCTFDDAAAIGTLHLYSNSSWDIDCSKVI